MGAKLSHYILNLGTKVTWNVYYICLLRVYVIKLSVCFYPVNDGVEAVTNFRI